MKICSTRLICIIFLLIYNFLSAQKSDTIKFKIKTPCRCKIDKVDSIGGGELTVDIFFIGGLEKNDFDCYSVRLFKNDSVIACIRNIDSSKFVFKRLSTGIFRLQFFADGYYTFNPPKVLRRNVKETESFSVGPGDLPNWLLAGIRKKRKAQKKETIKGRQKGRKD